MIVEDQGFWFIRVPLIPLFHYFCILPEKNSGNILSRTGNRKTPMLPHTSMLSMVVIYYKKKSYIAHKSKFTHHFECCDHALMLLLHLFSWFLMTSFQYLPYNVLNLFLVAAIGKWRTYPWKSSEGCCHGRSNCYFNNFKWSMGSSRFSHWSLHWEL